VLGELVPAAGQGALALQARAGAVPDDVVTPLRDAAAAACLAAERALVHALGASCNTPVGAHATPLADTAGLELVGWVGLPDGTAWLSDRVQGEGGQVGTQCAERMLAAGARELLEQAERELAA
jgi:hydroxymethylbilane synthase